MLHLYAKRLATAASVALLGIALAVAWLFAG